MGGDNPPSDPATTAAAGVCNIDHGVNSAAATSVILDLRSPTDADANTGEEDDDAVALSYWATALNPLLAMETIA